MEGGKVVVERVTGEAQLDPEAFIIDIQLYPWRDEVGIMASIAILIDNSDVSLEGPNMVLHFHPLLQQRATYYENKCTTMWNCNLVDARACL